MNPLVVAILFHGIALAPHSWRLMDVTAYCPGVCCCQRFADGITASGLPVTVNRGKLVAGDAAMFPLGALVSIPGYDEGRPVPVLDRGGKWIRGHRLDVLFPTHAQAKNWGMRRRLWVQVWKGKQEDPDVSEMQVVGGKP